MEEKMESENSYSGGSTTSSDSSSDSSDAEEELLESVRILGQTLDIPQELCEDYSVFREFFSMKTWNAIESDHKKQLLDYLPKFDENDKEEKEKTVKMLFNHEPFHFRSPLDDFYYNLRQGNYRPDIAKMRKFLKKARSKQQRHKIKSYYARLLPEVLITRERVLAAVKAAPPGPIPHLPLLPLKPIHKNNLKPIYVRTKQRYFEELAAIRSEVGGQESDDDIYPEGPPKQMFKKRNKQSNAVQNADSNVSGTLGGTNSSQPTSVECLKNVLAAHRARRQYRENHPELNTTGITLEDIKQRVALVNGAKKLMFGGQKTDVSVQKVKRMPKKEPSQKQTKDIKSITKKSKEEDQNVDNKALLPHIKIKCEPESDSEISSLVDPITSPKPSKKIEFDIKQEIDAKYPEQANFNSEKMETTIKQEPPDIITSTLNTKRITQPVPLKLEDLDGIDMMALPVDLADDSGELMDAVEPIDRDESLTETTHANFFSLVRALFPARTAHRASKQQLRARLAAAMKSPIAPLNTWYSLSDDWCAELDSALEFLAAERGPHPDDYVPYLQYIAEIEMYQWIGAGRDCDALLGRLHERWRSAEPPPPHPHPRYPTSWCVRPSTSSELAEFRAQERRRFSSAAKPFTYIQHGYRAVVGPLTKWSGADISDELGSSLLVVSRPKHASFAALTRDAIARLPNGEGTRTHILILLKMSQWIMSCSERALVNALTSTLDKLHAIKRDPVIKYDHKSAVWIYLHRHRSEEEWLKSVSVRRSSKTLPPPPPPLALARSEQTPSEVEPDDPTVEEVMQDASDSDVDVDDSSASTTVPHLSSAQLLMQAQAQAKKLTPVYNKPKKGKLIPTPTQKSKSNQKAQTAKQANLMAQSAKLANLIAQSKANLQKQAAQTKQTLLNPPQKLNPTKPIVTQAKEPQIIQDNKVTIKQSPPQSKPATTKATNSSLKTSTPSTKVVKQNATVPAQKQNAPQTIIQVNAQTVAQEPKSSPSLVKTPHVSPLIKQRPFLKTEVQVLVTNAPTQTTTVPAVVQTTPAAFPQNQNKMVQGTRSLLIRPAAVQATLPSTVAPVAAPTPTATQTVTTPRRSVVRVLSPATPSPGKSLISPRALMQQSTPTTKKRTSLPTAALVTTLAHTTANATSVVSSAPTVVTSSITTRTVQLPGGRTVQLANQTVHLPGGQAVQITPGHTLQLSSLQLPTHSVRLPSGQTVQLASPQTVQTVKAMSTTAVKNPSPRVQQTSIVKTNPSTSQSSVQIPVSSVQLSGQTVQIGGQSVQLSGQSVQLTGHTVKLPSGQSVQVASQSVLPSQSVQLPSGQTVQLAQLSSQSVQLPSAQLSSGQSVQLGSQTVQIGGQTVQLPGGQTVQLPSGQTVQLPSGQTLQLATGQTVQFSTGQTLQLASGQTVQLANQQTSKPISQLIRAQMTDKTIQPIVAKLLTTAQPQMLSLEAGGAGSAGGSSGAGAGGARGVRGVRVLAPARPLLLAAAGHKPLHNIILQKEADECIDSLKQIRSQIEEVATLLSQSENNQTIQTMQQSDGTTIRVTSSGGATPTQTLVLGNIGTRSATTSTSSAPVLKLQQVTPIQQVKLPQGIKIQQASGSTSVVTSTGVNAVRSVIMDGHQLKLVGGRHVLARLIRPTHPP